MESAQGPLANTKVVMGNFKVVQVKSGDVTIYMGGNVHTTIHLGTLPHTIKVGDLLPIYTQIHINEESLRAQTLPAPKQ